MKTLIVSDVHLTRIFNKRKYAYLVRLFSSVDRIILNGDFWDGYRTTFDRFVKSKWSALFPLLKEKQTIYLYGNHDAKKFCDKRVALFSVTQGDSFLLHTESDTLHVEHGHRVAPTFDMVIPIPYWIIVTINFFSQVGEYLFTHLFNLHFLFLKRVNRKIKRKLEKQGHGYWYLCGHTHYAEIDKDHKFANSGYIQYRRASYLIADSAGLTLHKERY